jgi:hypothetical protein
MQDASNFDRSGSNHAAPAARYLSSADVERLLQLLIELKDVTLSRASYQRAAGLIAELGGSDRLGNAMLAAE